MTLHTRYVPCPYFLAAEKKEIQQIFRARVRDGVPQQIFAKDKGLVITAGKKTELFQWGFEAPWTKNEVLNVWNCREENLQNRFWTTSFERNRCLVPATSFGIEDGRLGFHPEHKLFAFLAVSAITERRWFGGIEAFAIVTRRRPAGRDDLPIRCPVLVGPDDYKWWLSRWVSGDDAYRRLQALELNVATIDAPVTS